MKGDLPVGRAIGKMTRFFLPHCRDKTTLLELEKMAADGDRWRYAHDLFDRIRRKTLNANSDSLQWQYAFEEICAKTLFNLSGSSAPFDDDSAFWVVPFAISFARAAGIEKRFFASCNLLLAESS